MSLPKPLQFDLFAPLLTDFQLRDQREIMERPFFSLSKKKRLTNIEYVGTDGVSYVKVEPGPAGMPTIWDADILIWAASQLTKQKNDRVNDIPRTLRFLPHDLLRSIGRDTGGAQYERLRQAMQRLKTATVTTNVRGAKTTKKHVFSWIESWKDETNNQTALSHGMEITVSDWFYEGVLMEGGVLTINPDYFTLTGGRERWLYRVARKHAGGAGPEGFAMKFSTLFDKSGAEGEFRRFKFEILKIVREDTLPDFRLSTEQSDGPDPMLRIRSRATLPAAAKPASKSPAKSHPAPATAKSPVPDAAGHGYDASRDLLDSTRERIRRDFPGLDIHYVQREFDEWLLSRGQPQNYGIAFYGFCRTVHKRHKP